MENENWLPVLGYEGLYEVSDLGNVRSKPRLRLNGKFHKGRFLKAPTNSQGRRTVVLYKDGKSKSFHPYRLVAEAFMGISSKIVCHKNGDKCDDRLCNLYYGTPKQNTDDRVNHGTMFYGEKVHNSILSNNQVLQIKKRYKFRCKNNGTMALAKEYGVSPSTISAIISGQNWSHLNPMGAR